MLYCIYLSAWLQLYNVLCQRFGYALETYALLNIPVIVVIAACLLLFTRGMAGRRESEVLLARHATIGQAEFFLRSRGGDLGEPQRRHARLQQALATVSAAIPLDWHRAAVERADLDRFAFTPDDLVVAVGQDGLVANVAKYLRGQPVIGIAPETAGVLTRLPPEATADLLRDLAAGRGRLLQRTMVAARTDTGEQLVALNEIYLGHPSHQSARYRLRTGPKTSERQSSSGIIVGTGTGSTGWCASLATQSTPLPTATEDWLAWFVREAWPSPTTGTGLTSGRLEPGHRLQVDTESDGLVAFGDGIESDHLSLAWGQRVEIAVADTRLALAE